MFSTSGRRSVFQTHPSQRFLEMMRRRMVIVMVIMMNNMILFLEEEGALVMMFIESKRVVSPFVG